MPELDSPVLTLGALFVAGQDDKGRRFTGGESGKGILAGGFAGASAEYAADRARGFAGVDESAVSDELAQALVGAALSRWGGMIPQNKAMARGIHYNVATQAIQDAGLSLGDFAGDVTQGSRGRSGGGQQGSPQEVHDQTRHNGDVVVY